MAVVGLRLVVSRVMGLFQEHCKHSELQSEHTPKTPKNNQTHPSTAFSVQSHTALGPQKTTLGVPPNTDKRNVCV